MDTKRLKQIYWRIYPFIRSMIGPADRQQSPSSISSGDEKLTRDCLDPWNYLEVSAEGMVKPCCILPPLENILQAPPDRNSNRFRELRKSLLSGELTSSCKTCHIRDMVPARALRQKVQAITRKNGADPDLCGPAEVQSIRIDITQDCNLRCVYCAVSQPNYAGVHMSQEVFDKVFTMIPTGRDSVRIDLNGHGETTFHPHWVDYVTRVQKTGAATTLLSNFAKPFSEAEISAFAHVGFIQISLDTVDDSMLRDIRRKVSLETIVGNIKKIKDYAK